MKRDVSMHETIRFYTCHEKFRAIPLAVDSLFLRLLPRGFGVSSRRALRERAGMGLGRGECEILLYNMLLSIFLCPNGLLSYIINPFEP